MTKFKKVSVTKSFCTLFVLFGMSMKHFRNMFFNNSEHTYRVFGIHRNKNFG